MKINPIIFLVNNSILQIILIQKVCRIFFFDYLIKKQKFDTKLKDYHKIVLNVKFILFFFGFEAFGI